MKRLFFFLFFFSLSSFGRGLDYQLGASGRNYPIGARVTAFLGYSMMLWENEAPPSADPSHFSESPSWKYGYIRPNLMAETSYFISRSAAEVEFYPVSIAGFAVGRSWVSRGKFDFPDFDCDVILCDGSLRKDYVRAQLVGAAGGVSLLLRGRVDWFSMSSSGRPFIDDISTLVAEPGQDRLESLTLAVTKAWNEKMSFGLASDSQRYVGSGSNNQGLYVITNARYGPWRLLAGLGGYKSSHQGVEPSAFFDLRWIGIKDPGVE